MSWPDTEGAGMTKDRARYEPVLAPGAALEKVATGATWGEGPLWLPEERVIRWSDIPGNRILQYRPATGEMTVHRNDVEFTNGRTLDLEGRVVQCSHGRRAVEREVDGAVTVLVDRWQSVRFNSPNDIVVKSDGTIWFTDPSYGITKSEEGHPGELEYGDHYVFRFDPGSDVRPVIIDMGTPNGLAFSPDESVLYVSDTSEPDQAGAGEWHVRAYDVIGSACKNGRGFARVDAGVVDGFRVDEKGCLWLSSLDAVVVVDPDGEQLARVPVPERIGNLCFGGDDGRDLYIAASTSLYRIRTTVRDAARRVRG